MADDNPYTIRTPSAAKQFGISLFFGALAAFLTYQIADKMASPDTAVGVAQTRSAYKFVFYMAALAGGIAFIVASKIYKHWADKQYAKSLEPPQAIVRKAATVAPESPAIENEPSPVEAASSVDREIVGTAERERAIE